MSLSLALFYIFASVTVLSGVMVVSARNPVHAVLYLILAFFNAAGLFLLAGAEFLAFMLIIVYVGAVAVLFLFVVMMLDIDFAVLRQGVLRHLPLGLAVAAVLLSELVMVFAVWQHLPRGFKPTPLVDTITNTHALGAVLYTDFAYPFIIAGMILLTAMIGAIMLTLRHRPNVRRQNVAAQNNRNPSAIVSLTHPEVGKGVTL